MQRNLPKSLLAKQESKMVPLLISKVDSVIDLVLEKPISSVVELDVENLSQEHQRSGLTQFEYP